MKSLSEIETTVKRASRAAGYSWGIAEEVGKSIRLSELFGFPGIKHLNQYYQNKKKENFNDIKLINKVNKSNGLSFCPITLGVNFIDQVKDIESLTKCSIEKFPYSEIQDNTIGENLVPIDMLRLKLSFFGALKFDPRSDKWLRICMFQGAPLPNELKDYDEQWVYKSFS